MGDVEIVIERLDEDNFKLFYKLFTTVFGNKLSFNAFANKYNSPFYKKYAYLGFLAIANKKAVSYSGSIPFEFQINGKSIIGAHSCDHMTLKDFRGKGLFSKLCAKEENLLIQRNIPFIYGFPNQNNHEILVKRSNWEIAQFMVAYSIPVLTIPFKKIFYKLIRKPKYRKTDNSISGNLSYEYDSWTGIKRSNSLFKYKLESLKKILQFKSGTCFVKIEGNLFLGDFILNKNFSVEDLFLELKSYCRRKFISKIIFLCSQNHFAHEALQKQFNFVNANAVGFKFFNPQDKFDFNKLCFSYLDYDTF